MCSAATATGNGKRTAFIADDDEVARGLLKSVLRAAGLHVVGEAADGKQALSEAQRLSPDVVCLDINMPLMNGVEVLAHLRADNSTMIVLLVTASPTAQNVKDAIQARVDGVIVKPFNVAKVRAEIERAAARRAEVGRTPSL